MVCLSLSRGAPCATRKFWLGGARRKMKRVYARRDFYLPRGGSNCRRSLGVCPAIRSQHRPYHCTCPGPRRAETAVGRRTSRRTKPDPRTGQRVCRRRGVCSTPAWLSRKWRRPWRRKSLRGLQPPPEAPRPTRMNIAWTRAPPLAPAAMRRGELRAASDEQGPRLAVGV